MAAATSAAATIVNASHIAPLFIIALLAKLVVSIDCRLIQETSSGPYIVGRTYIYMAMILRLLVSMISFRKLIQFGHVFLAGTMVFYGTKFASKATTQISFHICVFFS
jgi:hypothetical protein